MRRVPILTLLAVTATASAAVAAEAASISTHQLTVNIAGTGSGMIHGSNIDCAASSGGPVGPCNITEVSGNKVTLTATADKGSIFTGWSGGGCSGTGACTVTLSSNVKVTATFKQGVVAVEAGPLTVSASNRTAQLPLRCQGPGSCAGSVEFSTVVNGKTVKLTGAGYTMAQGARVVVSLGFSSSGISLIAKHGKTLNAELTVLPTNGQAEFGKRLLKLGA